MSHSFSPILTLTVAATAAITANRFITSGGAVPAADANALGVARSGGVSGDKIPVDVLGTAVVESGAAVTINSAVKTDASGRAINWVTSGQRLGVALEAASAAGQFIEVLLFNNPGYTT